MLQYGSPSVLTIYVEYSGNLQTPRCDTSSLAEDIVKMAQNRRGQPRDARTAVLRAGRAHCPACGRLRAAARLLAPSLLPPPHAPNRACPALPRPSAASALPCRGGSLASRLRTPTGRAQEGKHTRLSSGLELTVPGPGAGLLLQRIVLTTPLSSWQAAQRRSWVFFPLCLRFIGVCRGRGGASA